MLIAAVIGIPIFLDDFHRDRNIAPPLVIPFPKSHTAQRLVVPELAIADLETLLTTKSISSIALEKQLIETYHAIRVLPQATWRPLLDDVSPNNAQYFFDLLVCFQQYLAEIGQPKDSENSSLNIAHHVVAQRWCFGEAHARLFFDHYRAIMGESSPSRELSDALLGRPQLCEHSACNRVKGG